MTDEELEALARDIAEVFGDVQFAVVVRDERGIRTAGPGVDAVVELVRRSVKEELGKPCDCPACTKARQAWN